ncbi:hypothetical protein SRHO_G00031420 [Serrasalmus rhombeus]
MKLDKRDEQGLCVELLVSNAGSQQLSLIPLISNPEQIHWNIKIPEESPQLYTLLTKDCLAKHHSNHIIKVPDDRAHPQLQRRNEASEALGQRRQSLSE